MDAADLDSGRQHGGQHAEDASRRDVWSIRVAYGLAGALSLLVVAAQWRGWLGLPLDTTEVLAFATGAWSVWLAARNSAWTWPVGAVNSALFVVLFLGARLYFDMGLNVLYMILGLWGWWAWRHGGAARSERPIGNVGVPEAVALALGAVAVTGAMWRLGVHIDDAAPFLDALTTALSLVAQWLMLRRFVEHWLVWIAVDLVYVPLYVRRDLPLTGALYAVFLLLCLRGLVQWRAIHRRQAGPEPRTLHGQGDASTEPPTSHRPKDVTAASHILRRHAADEEAPR